MVPMTDTPTDEHRAAAVKAAIEAARSAPERGEFYETVIDYWLTLETATALSAAVGALRGDGFHVSSRDWKNLHDRAVEAARTEFWRRHRIIDALNADVAEASVAGVAAALEAHRLRTVTEEAEHRDALKALARDMVP